MRWRKKDDEATRKEKAAHRNDLRALHYWPRYQLQHIRATEVRALEGIEAASAGLGNNSVETTLIYTERHQAAAEPVAGGAG